MRGAKLHQVRQQLQVNETQVFQQLLCKRMKYILIYIGGHLCL